MCDENKAKSRLYYILYINILDCPNKCHDTIILILTPHHNNIEEATEYRLLTQNNF